jgi:signal transduction histidine kinase/ligand-binding sensor domain-containing protein
MAYSNNQRKRTMRRDTRKAARLRFFCFVGIISALALFSSSALRAQRWHASVTGQPKPQAKKPLDDMAHMSWTRRDGAPSDIAALAQTTDGYLWIGSRRGLFRFDGIQFQSYPFTSMDPELPASDINDLAADPDGGLWIGYVMGGFTHLMNGKRVDYDQRNGLVTESTSQLVCRPDGSVWAIADGHILHLTESKWEDYSLKHSLASKGLYSLFFDHDGNLWTAEKAKVYELKKGEDQFALVKVPEGTVNQFEQLADGTIWISDAWKDVRPLHDDRRQKAVKIPGVPTMLADHEGSIWLANDTGGVTRIKHPGEAERVVENYGASDGLTDGQTHAILEDKQGTIWVATTRGLDRFRQSPLVQFRGVSLAYYPALIADKTDGIWLHDMDKPLMRFTSGHLSFVGQGHGSGSLFQDTDGSIWMLDQISRNFYRYSPNGGEPSRIRAPEEGRLVETWCLGKDLHGALLACFEGHGLWRYDHTWSRVDAPELPQESPLALVTGVGGRIWLGYPHSQIVLLDQHGYHAYGKQDGLELTSIFTFYDADGITLAGGSDGLAIFDSGKFHTLHLRSPELLRGISGIVKDRFGNVWLNAGLGVVRIPVSEWQKGTSNPGYAMDFQVLNEQDGLIGSPAQNKPTPSAIVDRSGLLWFATSGHLVSIDPAAIRPEKSTTNLQLQSVIINGKLVSYNKDAPISQDSLGLKTLEIEYNGIDLNSPERVVYQFMLEGEDKDWRDVGSRRQADYTNLSPGHYRFRVRAATGTGPWNELQSGPLFLITPPYYQTTWFYVISAIVIGSLLWVIYRARLQYITSQVQERLEARTQERLRIARDLHDTLLQGVQGLMLRFHFATEQLPAEEPARAVLLDALDRADEVMQEGRVKVRSLRTEVSAPAELHTNLRKAADSLETQDLPRINVLVVGEPRTLHPTVSDELYCIGREALTNAVLHAQATQIILELTYKARELRMSCIDNGHGVSPESLLVRSRQGHWGVVGMRERARNLGSNLDFSSKPGAGTEIRISVEGRRAYAKSGGDGHSGWFPKLSSFLEPKVTIISTREDIPADPKIEAN